MRLSDSASAFGHFRRSGANTPTVGADTARSTKSTRIHELIGAFVSLRISSWIIYPAHKHLSNCYRLAVSLRIQHQNNRHDNNRQHRHHDRDRWEGRGCLWLAWVDKGLLFGWVGHQLLLMLGHQ